MLACRTQGMAPVRSVKLENPLDELDEMRKEFDRLQQLYRTILPKVDPVLINDLLSRHEKTTIGGASHYHTPLKFSRRKALM
jgi:hypothetical protein